MPEIGDIVRITSTIAPLGALRKEFGVSLLLTSDASVLGAGGPSKIRQYGNHRSVASDFGSNTEPYKAAERYFSQEPVPKKLVIGRWAHVNVPTTIKGGEAPSLEAIKKISDGSLKINSDQFTGIDLSSSANLAAVATTLQTALRAGDNAALDDLEVTYDADTKGFIISSPTYLRIPRAAEKSITNGVQDGTDLSAFLKLDAEGSLYQEGHEAETVKDALAAIEVLNQEFYFVLAESSFNGTPNMAAVSEWANANKYMPFLESNEAGVLTTGDAVTEAAKLSATTPQRTALFYSEEADYKAVSAAARLSGVNMTGVNSIITLNLKALPGCTPDYISQGQYAELQRKNINFYSRIGANNALTDGRTLSPGIWIDVRYWLDWFVNATQVDVYNALYSSGRIPQTAAGVAVIHEAIETVCRQGVRNGGIAPGIVSPTMKGNIQTAIGDSEFDGLLSNGYLIYSTPLAEQSQTQRDERASPPFRVWLKGSGAIHNLDIDITFEN